MPAIVAVSGSEFARQQLKNAGIIDVEVEMGFGNCYIHGERLIYLSQAVYRSRASVHLAYAAHEVGHAEQDARFGWLTPAVRWLVLGNLILEWDASRRALRMLENRTTLDARIALKKCWCSYLVTALWQSLLMVAVLIGAWLWKRW